MGGAVFVLAGTKGNIVKLSLQHTLGVRAIRITAAVFLLMVTTVACGGGTAPSASVTARQTPVTAIPTSATAGSNGSSATATPTSSDGGDSPTPDGTSGPEQDAQNAAVNLAPFFAEARLADGRIHAAAALVNADIGTEAVIHFRKETIDAARATKPTAVARAIPAGLPPDLLRSVLLGYSDLVARSAAFNEVGAESERASLLACLSNGQAPAARFTDDLASAQALAEKTPAVRISPPDSRAAGEVALRVQHIDLANSGCAGCGGQVFTSLAAITWQKASPQVPDMPPTDGTIDGIEFWANYRAGHGWEVTLAAC